MRIKYPRTFHLPYSLGRSDDDKVIKGIDIFHNIPLVMTVKMDGENCTMTNDAVYARSVDSVDHPSRHWVKTLWSQIRSDIPEGWRICGENLFAKHSIAYENLGSYFHVFSVWNEKNECLSWDETVEWCELLGLTHVKVVANNFTTMCLAELHAQFLQEYSDHEGYVIRNRNRFHYNDFNTNVAKYVRENHVQTDSHWMFQTVVKNQL